MALWQLLALALVVGIVFAVRAIWRSRKRCPDCRKRVKVDASVCRYCGYRFET